MRAANGDAVVYMDSSALVKLVVVEPHSEALVALLADHSGRVCCALARVEAVRPQGPAGVARAREVLRAVRLLRLDDELLDDAASIDSRVLRGLDAIHLAAVRRLGDRVGEVVTYDRRMLEAASAWPRRRCARSRAAD